VVTNSQSMVLACAVHSLVLCVKPVYPPVVLSTLVPSQPKLVLIYRPQRDGRLSPPSWLITYLGPDFQNFLGKSYENLRKILGK